MQTFRGPLLLAVAATLAACATAADGDWRPLQVADGVYMLRGAAGEIGPENGGRVGNAGFIVGPNGVLVVDSGVSRNQGAALLAAIARVTDQPVKLLQPGGLGPRFDTPLVLTGPAKPPGRKLAAERPPASGPSLRCFDT